MMETAAWLHGSSANRPVWHEPTCTRH